MKKFIGAVVVAAVAMFGAVTAAQAHPWLKVGTLTCHVDPNVGLIVGSHKQADCIFQGANGKATYYFADITHVGLDVGVTGAQTLVWAVLAAGDHHSKGSLAGTYVGASAELTAIVGASANVLVGGLKHSTALQPVSVGVQSGLNINLGAASITLTPTAKPVR